MALPFKLQLVVVTEHDEQVSAEDLVVLNKALLLDVQRRSVSRQVAAFLAARTSCPSCVRRRGLKAHQTLLFRTLSEFLPVDAARNAASVRRDALSLGRRLELELGPEPDFPLAGCPGECASLPPPPAPITVGLDGGYLRAWDHKQTHFAAIVGESVPRDGPAKRFGFVQSHDPRRSSTR